MSKAPTNKKTASSSTSAKSSASTKATEKTADPKAAEAKSKTATAEKVSKDSPVNETSKPEAITLIPAETVVSNEKEINNSVVSSDKVAACAYFMWEKDGCQHGRDAEHWFRAEEQIRKELAAVKRK